MLKVSRKVYLLAKVFPMSVQNEKKTKTPPSVKSAEGKGKNGKVYSSYSDNDTSSTGSNESTLSTQVSSTKTGSIDSNSSSPIKTKHLSKSLRKKFFHHFPNIEEDEIVLDRYSCALLSDILLHGSLYITTNYFAFYSNVFGYVTKLLIPVLTVEDITKEKTAKIFPNAIGIVTPEQKHVFGSLMSRDSTLEFMKNVWEQAKSEAALLENELSDQMDYSDLEDDEIDGKHTEENTLIASRNVSMTITRVPKTFVYLKRIRKHKMVLLFTVLLLIILYTSAVLLLYRISQMQKKYSLALQDVQSSDSENLYRNILEWQTQLHSSSDEAVYTFLDSNLNQIAKVKQSLQTLSSLLVGNTNLNEENKPLKKAPDVLTT